MPIKVTLRKDKHQCPFRELLNMLLTSPLGDSAVLCSGYIWQPSGGGYNILDDGLRKSILKGCSKGTLTTVAGKFSYNYEQYYRNFVNDIRSHGINVRALYAPKKNWHAKVAIRLQDNTPVSALVGSSNLTGPAYGVNRSSWNYEADVLIWTEETQHNAYFRDDGLDLSFGKFETILDPEYQQPIEGDQLDEIYNDVMKTELQEFE